MEAGEAAEDAGLARGDVIVSVNGKAVSSVDEFEAADRGGPQGRGGAPARASRQGYRIVVLRLS